MAASFARAISITRPRGLGGSSGGGSGSAAGAGAGPPAERGGSAIDLSGAPSLRPPSKFAAAAGARGLPRSLTEWSSGSVPAYLVSPTSASGSPRIGLGVSPRPGGPAGGWAIGGGAPAAAAAAPVGDERV
jgi:hypothetical protein